MPFRSLVNCLKLLLLFILLFPSLSFSQEHVPTNFTGEKQELRNFFDELWGNFKDFDNSHCYRRAHVLAHQMKQLNVISDKVFFFFGNKLETRRHWWYHVAPMVYFNGQGVVLDKGLFKGATLLSDWIYAFGEGNQCEQIQTMDEYRSKIKSAACLYMIVPMYYYSPASLENPDIAEFSSSDLEDMTYSLSPMARRKYLATFPIRP